jgi:ribonuclease VapC
LIAVDTSALLSIVFDEPDAPQMLTAIAAKPCIVGAPTAFEAWMAVTMRGAPEAGRALDRLLTRRNLRILAFESDHAALAQEAFSIYGKGRGHSARLNFGDCMTYAIAKRDDLPLLYKGDDFVHTDLRPALGAS